MAISREKGLVYASVSRNCLIITSTRKNFPCIRDSVPRGRREGIPAAPASTLSICGQGEQVQGRRQEGGIRRQGTRLPPSPDSCILIPHSSSSSQLTLTSSACAMRLSSMSVTKRYWPSSFERPDAFKSTPLTCSRVKRSFCFICSSFRRCPILAPTMLRLPRACRLVLTPSSPLTGTVYQIFETIAIEDRKIITKPCKNSELSKVWIALYAPPAASFQLRRGDRGSIKGSKTALQRAIRIFSGKIPPLPQKTP